MAYGQGGDGKLSYDAFKKQHLASGGQMSEGIYNRYMHQGVGPGGGSGVPGGGSGVSGGLTAGRGGGASGAFGAGAPGMPKYGEGTAWAGGAAAGAAAGAGFIAAGGLGSAGVLAAMGPVGWAAGAALLAYGLIKGKKSNKQFDGTIQTGGAEAFQKSGGNLATVSDGYIPTKEEFVKEGRWLMPNDSYAHDFGRTFEAKDAKYYDNFQKTAKGYLDSGDTDRYRATMKAHGFDAGGGGGGGAAASGGGGGSSSPAPADTSPVKAKPDDVSKPGSGLEDTIKVPVEQTRREYLSPKKKRRTGFFSYGGSKG